MPTLSMRLTVMASPRDGIAVDHPEPRSVFLPPRNFRGHDAVAAARRGEGEIAAEERWALFSERELSFFRSEPGDLELGKELVNGVPAAQEDPAADVDDRVRLEQRRHAGDVSGVLSRDQQALQVLRVAGRVSGDGVIHALTPLTVVVA